MFRLSTGKLALLFFLTFFLTVYFVPFLNLGGMAPDLWNLLILFYAFRVDWKKVSMLALAAGWMKDLISLRFFGIEIFSLGILSLLLNYAVSKLEREDPLIGILCVFLFCLLDEWLSVGSVLFLKGQAAFCLPLFTRGFWSAVYTLAVYPLVFMFFSYLGEPRRRNYQRELF